MFAAVPDPAVQSKKLLLLITSLPAQLYQMVMYVLEFGFEYSFLPQLNFLIVDLSSPHSKQNTETTTTRTAVSAVNWKKA